MTPLVTFIARGKTPYLPWMFWSNVNLKDKKQNDCWEWVGYVDPYGYGRVTIANKSMRAHRVAWMFANNEDIPEGLVIHHICHNRRCCNYKHLTITTLEDNGREAISYRMEKN